MDLSRMRCRRCQEFGHLAHRCPAPTFKEQEERFEHHASVLQYSLQDARPLKLGDQLYVPVTPASNPQAPTWCFRRRCPMSTAPTCW